MTGTRYCLFFTARPMVGAHVWSSHRKRAQHQNRVQSADYTQNILLASKLIHTKILASKHRCAHLMCGAPCVAVLSSNLTASHTFALVSVGSSSEAFNVDHARIVSALQLLTPVAAVAMETLLGMLQQCALLVLARHEHRCWRSFRPRHSLPTQAHSHPNTAHHRSCPFRASRPRPLISFPQRIACRFRSFNANEPVALLDEILKLRRALRTLVVPI